MDNINKYSAIAPDDSWKTPSFRQNVVSKIDEAIQRSGMAMARNSSEMENHVFMKAKTKDDYMNMVAKLILHVRELSQPKQNQGAPNMQGPNQGQQGPPPQVQNQQPQQQQVQMGAGNQPGMAPDPINALQTLASQGSRNQMMNMGPQGQMQPQNVMGPNPNMAGMQGQMGQQGPIVSQGPQAQTATNLLQTLNQRPQMTMQLQNKLGSMGMVGNPGQMPNQMMGGMGNPMGSQLQNQLAGPSMQGQMMPNMSMQNPMQVPMSGSNTMVGQMQCNQVVGNMGGQMGPNMQGQMPGQMVGGMGGNQMNMEQMMHLQGRLAQKEGGMMAGGYRAPPATQFLRQNPSPSAPSPGMPGPSPTGMGVMSGAMQSPMSMGGMGGMGMSGCAGDSPQHLHHHNQQQQQQQQQQRVGNMGMVQSPSSSLHTPLGAGGSPGAEEAAYREKVRQLSKYIEPLRRMVQRMVSEGENVEKLKKMKNLLDILSNPNKRMPLETLIKCEVVLEKLDFKYNERSGLGIGLPASGTGKEQIFNPLLEVVNNCLQSPFANHTLKRTFGSTLDALNGPEIKNITPLSKIPKVEEKHQDIPDVLQGEIARLDSRFKVSIDSMQLTGPGSGGISMWCCLDSCVLPAVPPLHLSVPRDYPSHSPTLTHSTNYPSHSPTLSHTSTGTHADGDHLLERLDKAMEARVARLPKSCSVSQLLYAWEMSVRQACAPSPTPYSPVPPLGL